MTDPFERFAQARSLGGLTLLRLRAECLLERIDNPAERPVTISDEDRETLGRIAVASRDEDKEFLGKFDSIYEQDVRDE